MLVLTRRANDKVVFPDLGISVEVLRISGNSVRVGVEAPPEVSVLRHELAEERAAERDGQAKRLSHAQRNRLNAANLALTLYQRQQAAGSDDAARESLARAIDELQELERTDDTPAPTVNRERAMQRALVVDDDANEGELLAGILRMSGFEVDTASDGCAALDYLSRNERPDVVLLDMLMPRCDGMSTISAIRGNANYDGLKVFAVSGTSPSELGVVAGAEGVDGWYSKPINPERLVLDLKRELATGCTAV